jgi:GGDEF domain-containing protein
MNESIKNVLIKGKQFVKSSRYLIEISLAFIGVDCINFLLAPHDLGWFKAPLHPYWLLILPMASYYGLVAGLLSGAVSALHLIFFITGGFVSKSEIQKILETHQLFLPLAFIFVGMLLGEIRQKYIDAERNMKKTIQAREQEILLTKQNYESTEKAKRLLEVRIMNQASTVKTLYEVAKKFESLETDNIYKGCLEMLENHFQVQKSSIYLLRGDFLILKMARGWQEGQEAEGKINQTDSLMQIAIHEKRVVTVKEILQRPDASRFSQSFGELLAMFPILNSRSEVVGIVNIEKMDFLSFHKANIDLIELVVDWMSQALKKSEVYGEFEKASVWDRDHNVFNYNFFVQSVERELNRAKRFKTSFSVALFKLEQFGFLSPNTQRLVSSALAATAKQCLQDTDLFFKYRFDGTFAALCPFITASELQDTAAKIKAQLESAWKGLPEKIHPALVVGISQVQDSDTQFESLVSRALKEWQKKATPSN